MMKNNIIKCLGAGTLALALMGSSAVSAQVADEDALSQEEQVDNGLKNFGYIAGLSHGCVAEDQKTAFERDVLEMHAAISRLLGIDRGFLFSAAYGYGTSVVLERENCAEVLRQYENRTEKFRGASQGN